METVGSEPRRGLKKQIYIENKPRHRDRVSINEEALISANKVRTARETLRPVNGRSFVNFNCNLMTTDDAEFRLIIRIDERETSPCFSKTAERRKGVKDDWGEGGWPKFSINEEGISAGAISRYA